MIPVSVHWDGEYGISDVCMSLQGVIGIEGVKDRVTPDLNDEEIEGLENSTTILKESLSGINLD